MTPTRQTCPACDPLRVVAQVAVEAVADDPGSFDHSTRAAVLDVGRTYGVPAMYLDLIPPLDGTT